MAAGVRRAVMSDKKRGGAGIREILLAGPQSPVVRLMEARALAAEAGEWVRRRSTGRP
jgi:hypothetical protein